MSEETGRFEWVAKLSGAAMMAAMILLGLAMVPTVAVTVIKAMDKPEWTTLTPWVLAIVAELAALCWSLVLYGLARVIVSSEFNASNAAGKLSRNETLLEQQGQLLAKLVDLESLSDQAKSLIFRDREIEAFREAIHEMLMQQDYETAEALADNVEKKFGYADEAARLRQEVADNRKASIDEKIDSAIRRIDALVERHDWARAIRQAKRLYQMFPNNPKVAALPDGVEAQRTEHKRQLLQDYGEAIRKNDVEKGVELLTELDLYLTPQEAAALAESARGVLFAKLHNLGVQFALCVTEEQWEKAVATGEEIVRSYPNSRMAHEVRSKMDQLRAKAATASAATPVAAATGAPAVATTESPTNQPK